MSETTLQTREQRYAASAYDQVKNVQSVYTQKEQTQYGSMAHQLPILIRTAGLAQAIAFVHAKGKQTEDQRQRSVHAVYHRLLDDLASTVGVQSGEALLQQSRNSNLFEYMQLTQRILDALLWYKRLAQSILDVDPTTTISDLQQEEVPDNEQ